MFNENNLIKYAWLKDINSLLMGIKLTLHYTQLWLVYNHEKLTLVILVGVLTRRSGSQLVMLRVSSSQMLMQEATQ